MMQKLKTFLLFLFVTVVAICIASVTILLVYNDVNRPLSDWWKRDITGNKIDEKITITKPVTDQTEETVKEEEYIVHTDKGSIRGAEQKYKYPKQPDGVYYSFQGIPYAQPPIGPLRFKEPKPVEKWEDVLDATKEKDVCPQKLVPGRFSLDVIGSEDCLYLNVYTPQKPDDTTLEDKRPLLPVMVWIHGGGFQYGSGNSDNFGPDFLIENGVILVTFNYRLGAFGFLNLNVPKASGNAGLKDQEAVLEWVHLNILKFGGDPKNVTLFGNDAGAVAIEILLLTSVYKKGLFHRIILQSGAVSNPWAFDTNPEDKALRLGKYLNITSVDYNSVVNELMKVPANEIIVAQHNILTIEEIESLNLYAFVPSVEVKSDRALVSKNPLNAFAEGIIPNVPCIIGINNAEANAAFAFFPNLITPQLVESLNEVPDFLIPSLILSNFESEMLKDYVKTVILKYYFKSGRITWKNLPEFMTLLSDGLISIGAYMTTELLKLTSSPLYVYEFNMEGELNYIGNKAKRLFAEKYANIKTDGETNSIGLSGASHYDELGYLFLMNKFDKEVAQDSAEYNVRNEMSKLWTNFAKTENPNGDNVSVHWEMTTENRAAFLKIGSKLEMADKNINSDRALFWKNLFIAVFKKSPGILMHYLQVLDSASVPTNL